EIEVAVAIVIAERRGEARPREEELGRFRRVLEGPVAAVPEQGRESAVDAADEEVEIAVAVLVGEDGPGARDSFERDAGRLGDVRERPVAEVPEEPISPGRAADDVEIEPAVSVEVAGGGAARHVARFVELDLDVAVRVRESRRIRHIGEGPRRGTSA